MGSMRVLLVYHTVEGQTAKIANRVADVMRAAGAEVQLSTAETAPAPTGFQGLVVGDSIHAGHYSRAVTSYLTQHAAAMSALPVGLFQVSLTSVNPDEKHTRQAESVLHGMLDKTHANPDLVAYFGGALKYTQYGWIKRHVLRAIAKHEGGDTDTTQDHEYTDWAAVEKFANDALDLFRKRTAAPEPTQA